MLLLAGVPRVILEQGWGIWAVVQGWRAPTLPLSSAPCFLPLYRSLSAARSAVRAWPGHRALSSGLLSGIPMRWFWKMMLSQWERRCLTSVSGMMVEASLLDPICPFRACLGAPTWHFSPSTPTHSSIWNQSVVSSHLHLTLTQQQGKAPSKILKCTEMSTHTHPRSPFFTGPQISAAASPLLAAHAALRNLGLFCGSHQPGGFLTMALNQRCSSPLPVV